MITVFKTAKRANQHVTSCKHISHLPFYISTVRHVVHKDMTQIFVAIFEYINSFTLNLSKNIFPKRHHSVRTANFCIVP